MVGTGESRQVKVGHGRRGLDGHGLVRLGRAGKAWRVRDWRDLDRQGRHGVALRGELRLDTAGAVW
jgi:hypothetical protein